MKKTGTDTHRAVSYLRTSSAANTDGDSPHRQDAAVMGYAKRAGVEVVACFWDKAVSGADAIDTRAGFVALLAFCETIGVKTIIVETANRFCRDLIVQETGFAMLTKAGFALIAADHPDSFTSDTPTAVLIRQILGAVAQFDKTMVVDKLKVARDRASERAGRRVEGRKGYQDTNPQAVREARRLARKSPKTGKARTLMEISAELAALGYLTGKGKPFAPVQVGRLIGRDAEYRKAGSTAAE